MTHRMPFLLLTGLTVLGLLALSITPAHAYYIDPGSGSYLFQLAIGGLMGAIYALRNWFTCRRRLLNAHCSRVKKHPGSPS